MRPSSNVPTSILACTLFGLGWLLAASPSNGRVWRVDAISGRSGAGAGLQETIDQASAGDVVAVGPGTHSGPIRVDRAIVLRGAGGAIDGGGRGRVLTLAPPGNRVVGRTHHASGSDIGHPDACIYLEPGATDSIVRDNHLYDCAFGIWVHETEGAQLIANRIRGRAEIRVADRGNGIQLHDASRLVVRDNEISGARDGIYVAATEDSLIERNEMHDLRFGIHYMYSYRNRIRDNESRNNKIGFALMGSLHLVVTGNRAFDNVRNGLLFRDVQYCRIEGNRLERNGTGLFFYSSTDNEILANEVIDNELGIKVWAGSRRNRVEGNVIRGNRRQVFYVGAEDQIWGESGRGNHWSDYLGWDQDGDGIGDRPYRLNSLEANLLQSHPSVSLLLRSPALEILSQMAARMPILHTPTIVDVAPLLDPDVRVRDTESGRIESREEARLARVPKTDEAR
jgi:nitrous oxidase accessory protein